MSIALVFVCALQNLFTFHFTATIWLYSLIARCSSCSFSFRLIPVALSFYFFCSYPIQLLFNKLRSVELTLCTFHFCWNMTAQIFTTTHRQVDGLCNSIPHYLYSILFYSVYFTMSVDVQTRCAWVGCCGHSKGSRKRQTLTPLTHIDIIFDMRLIAWK